MSRNTLVFIGVLILGALSLWVVWPQKPANYFPSLFPWPEREWIEIQVGDFSFVRKGMTLGLDLKGGTYLVLEADISQRPPGEREDALMGVKRIIEQRINAYGVSEPIIQKMGTNRISIELPGVRDIQEAKSLIGKTAQLDFREQKLKEDGAPEIDETGNLLWVKAKGEGSDGQQKELTGAYFRPNAAVVMSPQSNLPEVSFEFDPEGAKLFEQITKRLINKPLGIFLDDRVISAPIVQAVISSRGVITGMKLDEARTLTIQLNAGALPVPVTIVKEQDVDATLGADSVRKSIIAGEIGLGVVLTFMLLHYRLPGFLAGCALIVYALLVLSIFKLVPVTLTLAGIAAFVISVGMAVDANILIFERLKEELRTGRTMGSAVEMGFERAWPSIRDSNISTFITCAILFWFGRQFGANMVMGFAITLAVGVAVSMFSAITITRTFLRLFIGSPLSRSRWLFGI